LREISDLQSFYREAIPNFDAMGDAARNQAIQTVTRDPQHANFVQRVGFMQEMRDGTATYTRVGQPPT